MYKLFDPVKECVFDFDFSCKFSKLQYNSLAFVAGSNRATDEGSLPELFLLLPKDLTFIFCCLCHLKGKLIKH